MQGAGLQGAPGTSRCPRAHPLPAAAPLLPKTFQAQKGVILGSSRMGHPPLAGLSSDGSVPPSEAVAALVSSQNLTCLYFISLQISCSSSIKRFSASRAGKDLGNAAGLFANFSGLQAPSQLSFLQDQREPEPGALQPGVSPQYRAGTGHRSQSRWPHPGYLGWVPAGGRICSKAQGTGKWEPPPC